MLRTVLDATCRRKPVKRLPQWGRRQVSIGPEVSHPDPAQRDVALGGCAGGGTGRTGALALGGQTLEPRRGQAS